MTSLANWGNYPVTDVRLFDFEYADDARSILSTWTYGIPRGMGRCYGDASLSKNVISTLGFDKILAFDLERGIVQCQSGVTLETLLQVIVPKGWFLPVTPGTKFVTVGGALASDVHGKNHHNDGTFSKYVLLFSLMLADGNVIQCSRDVHADLFEVTAGGMGLTGIILDLTIKLKPIETPYIRMESIKAPNLDAVMDLFDRSEAWTYTVAWLDCLKSGGSLGRSILMRGEHLRQDECAVSDLSKIQVKGRKRAHVPFFLPECVLNRYTVTGFNALYYSRPIRSRSIVRYDTFFYPLDMISNWNRIYGRRGFLQYQFVVPKENSRICLVEILTKINHYKAGSFLVVLKLLGRSGNGVLSFPIKGYTLAIDFPVVSGVFELLDTLDEIVLRNGGRLYLTKDARMAKDTFFAGYPKAKDFVHAVRALNYRARFRSLLSDRLGITS